MKGYFFLIISIVFMVCPCRAQERGSLTDPRDGRKYETVKIGDQWWMAENLAYIPRVSPLYTDNGIYVYNYKGFDVDSARRTREYQTYGCLYNWKLANSVCPPGWHLSSDDDWKQMEKYLGMSSSEADSIHWRNSGRVDLKIISSSVWGTDNGVRNESGFSALPGGISFTNQYMRDTIFGLISESAGFWTSTKDDDKKAWSRGIYIKTPGLGRAPWLLVDGQSVRCVKDKN